MTEPERPTRVCITLLGRFEVAVDGRRTTTSDWPVRRAAELVQLLAVTPGRRLVRDRVIDALWPHLPAEAGAANLRKAAFHARRVLGDPEAVMLRAGSVALFPHRTVETDADTFAAAAAAATTAEQVAAATQLYSGELLPDARYADWAAPVRENVRTLYGDLLRRAGRWDEVAADDPADEHACRALMRAALDTGNRHAAIRAYGRLRTALAHELGVRPGAETEELYRACVAGLRPNRAPVVGRAVALAEAQAALLAGDRGEQSALLVRGSGGIGKSTVCRELVGLARDQGRFTVAVRVLADSGPFAPLVAAVESLITSVPDAVTRLPERTRSVLAELTVLGVPAAPVDGPITRHQVVGAVRRLISEAAGTRPALLVIDDAHLADDDAIEALLHLAGVEGSARPFLVLAYRNEQTPEPLARGAARLRSAGAATALDLHPLDRDDAATLVRTAAVEPLPDPEVEAIVDAAGGNPFFLLELARSGPGSSRTAVHEIVTARFVELGEDERALVQRLAVAGDGLDPAGVVAVSGLAEPDAFALLDRALAADILVVTGTRYRFRHELVRQALVDLVPPHRRMEVHRDAARRLAEIDGNAAAIAAHWLAGDRPDEAAPWLIAAARDAIRVGAFRDALGHADAVLASSPRSPDALRLRAESLEALGDDRAPAAYAAAARAVGDEAQRQELRAKQALALVRAGDPSAAMEVLAGVRATTLDGRLAQTLALSGAAAMGSADPATGIANAAATRTLAMSSGDPAAVVIASWAEAAAAHAAGELPAGLRAVLHDSNALPDLAIALFDGQLCVAERLLYGNRPYAEVLAFADGLAAEADRLDAARGRAFAATFRGEAYLLTGRLDAAEADLQAGLDLHRAIGAAGGEALSLQRLAEVALHRGDRARVTALLDEALAVARESNLGFHLFDRIYGTRIAAAGDERAALAVLEEAEDAVHGAMETCPGCRIALAVPAAIAAADAGDLERAAAYEAVADRLLTVLMRLPGWYAAVDEVRAHRARAVGDLAAARAHFLAAARTFGDAGQPLDAERCASAADALGLADEREERSRNAG